MRLKFSTKPVRCLPTNCANYLLLYKNQLA